MDPLTPSPIPVIHITDLYHPPQDPDDQFDLATLLALPEIDLRAVILDTTARFLVAAPEGWDVPRDPGFVLVAQAAYLAGRSIPMAIGPTTPLRGVDDDASDRPAREQAGVRLLLETLTLATCPVVVTIVGSARVLMAAFNRRPDLVRERVRAVVINAGSTTRRELEWNVALDPHAFVALWRSGLTVHWYPCATARGAFDPEPALGTHWSATHAALLEGIPDPWRSWFAYGLSGSARGDLIKVLPELGRGATWENLLASRRSLWSTISLVTVAGRGLARTADGWRFVAQAEIAERGLTGWETGLDPIVAEVDEAGQVDWLAKSSNASPGSACMFRRAPGAEFRDAMAEALNALLKGLPV